MPWLSRALGASMLSMPVENHPSSPGGFQGDFATRRRERASAPWPRHAQPGSRSVAGIAYAAGVDRAFLYRHRDLLAQVHAL